MNDVRKHFLPASCWRLPSPLRWRIGWVSRSLSAPASPILSPGEVARPSVIEWPSVRSALLSKRPIGLSGVSGSIRSVKLKLFSWSAILVCPCWARLRVYSNVCIFESPSRITHIMFSLNVCVCKMLFCVQICVHMTILCEDISFKHKFNYTKVTIFPLLYMKAPSSIEFRF